MNREEQKEISRQVRAIFVSLLGEDKVAAIEDQNWVEFDRKPYDIYHTNEIDINFMEKDTKQDTVIHCTVSYNEDSKTWLSENCIDYPYKKYDTYGEMRKHLSNIESKIINNGFNPINLPK